jgi:hypothetical protein
VNAAGKPAVGAVDGGVITKPGADRIPTVTVPDAWPAVPPAGGVVPVVGGVVVPPVAPTLAVTVAAVTVCSVVTARPLASVDTNTSDSVPAVVEKLTGAEVNGFPLISRTTVEMVDLPPSAGTRVGFALTTTRPTAAVPTAIFTAPVEPTDAPPDVATIVAVPDAVPARNFTTTRPPDVCADDGWMVPSVVVNVTRVPSCGALPDASIT